MPRKKPAAQTRLNGSSHLENVSHEASGSHGKGASANGTLGSGSEAAGGAGLGSAASSRLGRSGGGSSVVSGGGTLARGGLSGSTALVQAANLGGSGRALGGTELLDVGLAGVLAILVAGVGLDAVGEELLADEGRQGLGVVLETGSRAVGSARAVVRQSSLLRDKYGSAHVPCSA